MEIKNLVTNLSNNCFIGNVDTVKDTVDEFLGVKTIKDHNNNLYCFKDNGAKKTLMLEAHIDEIGFIITDIVDGFLRVNAVGGIDPKILFGQRVKFFGKKEVKGIFCSTPPHLKVKEEKSFDINTMAVDTGLKDAKEFLSLGNFGVFDTNAKELNNNQITAKSLDNRAGAAAVLYAFKYAKAKYNLALLLSSGEELGNRGAIPGVFKIEPDYAVCVDVSFGETPGVPEYKTAKLGSGAMVGISPILNETVTQKLLELSNNNGTTEIMSGRTGTNSDVVSISKTGVKTGLVSIPLKNMHTPVEIADINDIKQVAELLIKFAESEEL